MLAGCAIAPVEDRTALTEDERVERAERAVDRGDWEDAASRWLELAEDASDLKRSTYLLEAASALLLANHVAAAQEIVAGIDERRLGTLQVVQLRTLTARIALAQNRPPQALEALRFALPADLPPSLRAEIHELRAHALRRSGDQIEAARELVLRDEALTGTDLVAANQQGIWQALIVLPEEALQRGIDPPPDAFAGWRELALIARAAQGGAADVLEKVEAWRARYPMHPASEEIIGLVIARQRDEVARPMQIAVLLPQSGPVAGLGQALRDGFLAAHFRRENKAYEPSIRFYDSGTDAAAVNSVYERAVADGADFVVGPLTRQAVNQLATTRMAVPTLMLNYTESGRGEDRQLYQFGLSPEDEARQVAHRAWLDGHNRALALVPGDEWGQRVLQAFREDWEELGGTLLEAQTYPAENNDYSEQIKRLLDLDESEQRRAELEKLLQQRLHFEPYRRQDADFIFMAAFPRQARLIRPQLRFHYAGELPVYSTSHVYSGKPDPAADRDIDDVIFCDMPWVLTGNPAPLKRDIDRLWPDAPGQQVRLYALGADAYDVIPLLNTLRLFRYERFNGQTGILQLADGNHLFRQLQWARFRNGVPRPYE